MKTAILNWTLRILTALIFIPAFLLKFSGAEKSIATFSKLGVEPIGRYFTGSLELLTVVLIFIPKAQWAGAGLGSCIMLGALAAHVSVLGYSGEAGVGTISATIALLGFLMQWYLTKDSNPLFRKLSSK
ncbi:DoxX-like family protein [Leptospira fainei serovar Hurstbridge str. BUT 6]|uniref:DoxX-like family protein n=1 Tax=Leptospira fainei serovar Hurstbridge str. BUT 6 TaxID=1193011 RepID=S3W6T0_9LEPT|nr:DoxX family membrane protein [Leptospira fainei]EPG75862.1 DoxX-like family protein [Leptospira fainei serovar Hurstbridge str. BUT 6]